MSIKKEESLRKERQVYNCVVANGIIRPKDIMKILKFTPQTITLKLKNLLAKGEIVKDVVTALETADTRTVYYVAVSPPSEAFTEELIIQEGI